MTWSTRILLIYLLLGIALLTWELLGIRTGSDAWPSITEIIVRWTSDKPWAKILVLVFLGWLFVHFARRLYE